MGLLEEYAARRNQQPQGVYMGEMRNPDDVRIGTAIHGGLYAPAGQTAPVVDSSNAIGSLAEMLGPTPAEREAAERRMLEGKAKMQAWTGLFDGLRQLGNLYYTSKGATPQSYANPYQYVDQQYQQQRQLYNDMANYRKQYANSLYSLQRQMETDKMAKEKHNAVLDWYSTRDEMSRLKAENDRLKTEQQIETQKARQRQIDAKTKQMEDLHPLQKEKLKAVIQNTLHNANRPYSTGQGGSSGNDPFTDLADMLIESPEVIGPILQQQGLGIYDDISGEFNFSKNPTKGMATTAVRRAAGNGSGNSRRSSTGTNGKISTGINWKQ